MRVSPHTARASEKVSLVGIPASPEACFTLPWIRMIVRVARGPTERTISPEGGRHLLSLLSSDSITFHVTRDQRNVSLLTEPGMSHPISRPLQPGIRFFPPPNPARHQHALRLACPTRRRRDWVPTFRKVDHNG